MSRPSLDRLLRPQSVAVVGASDTSVMAQTVASVVEHEVDAYFVHPKQPTVFGQQTYPSVADLPKPVDAVLSLVSAVATVEVAEQAADLGAGGLVVIASGFAEVGAEGAELQARLVAAAERGAMPVVGPNGVGFLDIGRGLDMTFLPRFRRRAGGASLVAHSGALLEAFAASAHRTGGVGLNLMISAGNEARTDVADYLDYLVDDDSTRVIALAIEKIRRPDAFFAAAARARRSGKPIVAVKLGRSDRARQMAQSHTGTVTGDAWVYDVAFAQAGIGVATEVDELVDQLQFLEQLPPQRWTPVRGLAVLTGTGGFAALSADLAVTEKVDMPDVERLNAWIADVVPGATVANPLDATGFVTSRFEVWEEVVRTYLAAPEFDTFVYLSQFAEWDTRSRRFSDHYVTAGTDSAKPLLVSPLAGPAGAWVDEYRTEHGVGVGNGLRGTLRGLQAMAAFVRTRPDVAVRPAHTVPTVPPPAGDLVRGGGGPMLSFPAGMRLLAQAGIRTADFHLVHDRSDFADLPFAGPFVMKLADVAHRTEHGAVLLPVPAGELAAAYERLQAVAAEAGLSTTVVVQPLVTGHGEAFLGLTGQSELGPLVAFGPGGIFVEVLRRIVGRLAPYGTSDAEEMLAELDDLGIADGYRGRRPWPRDLVVDCLVRAGELVAAGRDWIQTMDVNPLIVTDDGLVAVDATCFVAEPG